MVEALPQPQDLHAAATSEVAQLHQELSDAFSYTIVPKIERLAQLTSQQSQNVIERLHEIKGELGGISSDEQVEDFIIAWKHKDTQLYGGATLPASISFYLRLGLHGLQSHIDERLRIAPQNLLNITDQNKNQLLAQVDRLRQAIINFDKGIQGAPTLETRFFTRPDKDFVFKVSTSPLQCETLRHPQFAFKNTKTVNIGRDLFTFSENRLEVCQYQDMHSVRSSSGNLTKFVLGKHKHSRQGFATACYEGEDFFILGGWRLKGLRKKPKLCMTVLKFSKATKHYTKMPKLISGRKNLSACELGGSLYVFFGIDENDFAVKTVERLQYTADEEAWVSFRLGDNLPKFSDFVVCPSDENTILVMGPVQYKSFNNSYQTRPTNVHKFDVQTMLMEYCVVQELNGDKNGAVSAVLSSKSESFTIGRSVLSLTEDNVKKLQVCLTNFNKEDKKFAEERIPVAYTT